MNPLLFADWGRINRLFTKLMWTVAAIMVCVVFAVLTSTGRGAHATAATRAPAPGMAAGTSPGSGGAGRVVGASR
jgi:hypothetical protein